MAIWRVLLRSSPCSDQYLIHMIICLWLWDSGTLSDITWCISLYHRSTILIISGFFVVFLLRCTKNNKKYLRHTRVIGSIPRRLIQHLGDPDLPRMRFIVSGWDGGEINIFLEKTNHWLDSKQWVRHAPQCLEATLLTMSHFMAIQKILDSKFRSNSTNPILAPLVPHFNPTSRFLRHRAEKRKCAKDCTRRMAWALTGSMAWPCLVIPSLGGTTILTSRKVVPTRLNWKLIHTLEF